MESTKRQNEDNIDRVSQSAHKAVDRAASVASDYAERISAKGEQLMSMHEDWLDTAREYVRSPLMRVASSSNTSSSTRLVRFIHIKCIILWSERRRPSARLR